MGSNKKELDLNLECLRGGVPNFGDPRAPLPLPNAPIPLNSNRRNHVVLEGRCLISVELEGCESEGGRAICF